MQEKFKVCDNCGMLHILHRSYRDKRPTCYGCGTTNFSDPANGVIENKRKKQNGHTPIFCDWDVQHVVDTAASDILEYIEDKNKDNLSPEIKDDLKQYFVVAVNNSRKSFINSLDTFLRGNRMH